MFSAGIPDPDLVIRPGGEMRLSNFLMWESAYSELIFTDVLWPDFTERDIDAALEEYRRRDRRFGGIRNEAETHSCGGRHTRAAFDTACGSRLG